MVQTSLQSNPSYTALSIEEQRLKEGLVKFSCEENKMKGRKSKNQLTIYGDRNSACFHNSLKIKYAASKYHCTLDKDGNLCSTSDSIQNAFLHHYKNLLSEIQHDNSQLSHFTKAALPSNFTSHSQALIQVVTSDEIKQTIFSINSTSSPGLDGFNAHF